jgi:hypothetical protein
MEVSVKVPEMIQLSTGARRILETPNAGGTSVWSEAMSFEVLSMLFNAKLMHTEMELEYWPLGSKITDYSVILFDVPIGVSVTRAMKFRGEFTEEDAKVLLAKKLYGVNCSSKAVLKRYRWKKQILHIWVEHPYIADILMKVYNNDVEMELKANTIIMITCAGNASWIFT